MFLCMRSEALHPCVIATLCGSALMRKAIPTKLESSEAYRV